MDVCVFVSLQISLSVYVCMYMFVRFLFVCACSSGCESLCMRVMFIQLNAAPLETLTAKQNVYLGTFFPRSQFLTPDARPSIPPRASALSCKRPQLLSAACRPLLLPLGAVSAALAFLTHHRLVSAFLALYQL